MALKNKVIDDKGVAAEYFRIANIEQNFINNESFLSIYVYGYAGDSFRIAEKQNEDKNYQNVIWYERFRLPLDDKKGYSRNDIYKRLKSEINIFKDSEDC